MKPVPGLNKQTSVSTDYFNEYNYLSFSFSIGGPEYVALLIKKRPIKKYEERFPPSQYSDVVTPENCVRVSMLNRLADEVNAVNPENFGARDLRRVFSRINLLIYGKKVVPDFINDESVPLATRDSWPGL